MGDRFLFWFFVVMFPLLVFIMVFFGNRDRWMDGGRGCMVEGKFYAEIQYPTHFERVCVKDNVITPYKGK